MQCEGWERVKEDRLCQCFLHTGAHCFSALGPQGVAESSALVTRAPRLPFPTSLTICQSLDRYL